MLEQEQMAHLSSLYELDVTVYDLAFKLTGMTGSIFYMAPEVYLRQPYNEKADVFSFGVVLYELFASTLLALECMTHTTLPTPMEAAKAHSKRVSEGWRPPRMDDIPDRIWDLIQSCWQQNPGARADMAMVLEELWKIEEESDGPAPVSRELADATSNEVADATASEAVDAHIAEVVDSTECKADDATADQLDSALVKQGTRGQMSSDPTSAAIVVLAPKAAGKDPKVAEKTSSVRASNGDKGKQAAASHESPKPEPRTTRGKAAAIAKKAKMTTKGAANTSAKPASSHPAPSKATKKSRHNPKPAETHVASPSKEAPSSPPASEEMDPLGHPPIQEEVASDDGEEAAEVATAGGSEPQAKIPSEETDPLGHPPTQEEGVSDGGEEAAGVAGIGQKRKAADRPAFSEPGHYSEEHPLPIYANRKRTNTSAEAAKADEGGPSEPRPQPVSPHPNRASGSGADTIQGDEEERLKCKNSEFDVPDAEIMAAAELVDSIMRINVRIERVSNSLGVDVSALVGVVFQLTVPEKQTAVFLKRAICRLSNKFLWPSFQVLVFDTGYEKIALEDDKQLASYGIKDESTVFLRLMGRDIQRGDGMPDGSPIASTRTPLLQTPSPAKSPMQAPVGRNQAKKLKWTIPETEALVGGVERCGTSWCTIIGLINEHLQPGRTQVHLKDKWRNILAGMNENWAKEKAADDLKMPEDLKTRIKRLHNIHD
eukprot:gene1727-33134_t